VVITPLELRQEGLSELQCSLLKMGLQSYHGRAVDLACGLSYPGHFIIRTEMKKFSDRRKRASRRAAVGRALARLIKRGLIVNCCRGKWRLTEAGAITAQRFYPQITPLTPDQLSSRIGLHETRQAAHPKRGRRPRGSRQHLSVSLTQTRTD
jgi:restriction endonuclease Mrr